MNPVAARSSRPPLGGYLVEFETPAALRQACERIREAGYTRWDAHSPFPVHGLDGAMGLTPTLLPWIVFACGVFGALFGLVMQWWTNAVNYPMVISGKPLWSIPANIPVIFEMTVLFAAVGAFLAMVLLNGFPRYHHPVFRSERFRRATTDRFFISIEAADPLFDEEATGRLLAELGGTHLERLEA